MREQIRRISRAKAPQLTGLVSQAAAVICGFTAARAPLLGGCAPFGVAFAAGVPNVLAPAAAVGAALGYVIPVTGQSGFRYLAAVVCIALIKFLVVGRFGFTKTPAFAAVGAFAASAVTAAAVIAASGVSAQALLAALGEGAAAAAFAYFVAVIGARSGEPLERKSLSSLETIAAVAVIGVMLMALTPIKLGLVRLSPIAGLLIVLSAARCSRESAGVTAGAAIGLLLSLSQGVPLWLAGAFAAAGLLAGVFAWTGDVGVAVTADAVVGAFAAVAGAQDNIGAFIEAIAASVIFLILPRSVRSALALLFAPQPDMPRVDGLRKAVTMRLQFASEALSAVSDTVETVSAKLGRMNAPSFEQMLDSLEQDICARCGLRKYCWQDNRERLLASLAEMTRTEAAPELLPEEIGSVCSRSDELCAQLKDRYRQLSSREAAQRRVDEVRGVLIDQFSGISEMLYDMACEFESARRYDLEAAERVESALREAGLIPTDIGCSVDRSDRMTVEVRVQAGTHARFNRMTVKNAISAACGRDFEAPVISVAKTGALMTLTEHARLSADTGVFSLTMNDARLCGDAAEIFCDGKGKLVMLLCDGMGAGGRAAVDSAMAAGLMKRLLGAGFGYDCALRIANSAMRFKSTDESLSTVDLSAVDLFTGRTELYKAGACPTVVLRSGRTARAECASLPAGIVREVGFDSAAVMLDEGDIIVMFSDGATSEGTDWICAEVEAWKGSGSAQQLAEHIARSARRRRSDGHDDDITVLTAIIEKAVK